MTLYSFYYNKRHILVWTYWTYCTFYVMFWLVLYLFSWGFLPIFWKCPIYDEPSTPIITVPADHTHSILYLNPGGNTPKGHQSPKACSIIIQYCCPVERPWDSTLYKLFTKFEAKVPGIFRLNLNCFILY